MYETYREFRGFGQIPIIGIVTAAIETSTAGVMTALQMGDTRDVTSKEIALNRAKIAAAEKAQQQEFAARQASASYDITAADVSDVGLKKVTLLGITSALVLTILTLGIIAHHK